MSGENGSSTTSTFQERALRLTTSLTQSYQEKRPKSTVQRYKKAQQEFLDYCQEVAEDEFVSELKLCTFLDERVINRASKKDKTKKVWWCSFAFYKSWFISLLIDWIQNFRRIHQCSNQFVSGASEFEKRLYFTLLKHLRKPSMVIIHTLIQEVKSSSDKNMWQRLPNIKLMKKITKIGGLGEFLIV
jgi:hypothetical protein